MITNCPNCGAPIDLSRRSCEYCGTPYYFESDIQQLEKAKVEIYQSEKNIEALYTKALEAIKGYSDSYSTLYTDDKAIMKSAFII